MADWLVLERFEGIVNNQNMRLAAGIVVDDNQDPVAAIRANGGALIPNLAAYTTATAAFNMAHDPNDPRQQQESMIPVLQSYGIDVARDAGIAVIGTDLYVNGAYTGVSTGSQESPCKTYAAAAALAVDGDRILVHGGAYAEGLALVAGVDIIGLGAPRTDDVEFTGQLTAAFVGEVNLVNISITQNVAATATMLVTGANATQINLFGCLVEAGAAADEALDCDAVNATIFPWNSIFSTVTGNATETVLMSAGTLLGEQFAITHADGITGPATAINCDGTGVVDVVIWDFQLQGNVESVTGAQNPTITLRQGRIATGAQSAIQSSSTGECTTRNIELVSADADGWAVDGVGAFTHDGLQLTGTAERISATVNAGAGAGPAVGYGAPSISGSVACAQIIQAGQPVAAETLTVGADVYEADGAGANINFVIAGNAADTLANLLAAAVANGTEPLFWDSPAATVLRLRSASGPQGAILAVVPNIALTEAMTNYIFDCANVNMTTLGGRVETSARDECQVQTVNAGHAASGSMRFAFPFAVTRFIATAFTAGGVRVVIGTDTYLIENGDVEVVLAGGGLVATDVITIHAFE